MSTKEHATADDRPRAATRIIEAVGSWSGVELAPHRFGGVEFRLGRRELGHLHGDRIADLPFPRRIRDELVAVWVLPSTSAAARGYWDISVWQQLAVGARA
jgi:hypothetical protein